MLSTLSPLPSTPPRPYRARCTYSIDSLASTASYCSSAEETAASRPLFPAPFSQQTGALPAFPALAPHTPPRRPSSRSEWSDDRSPPRLSLRAQPASAHRLNSISSNLREAVEHVFLSHGANVLAVDPTVGGQVEEPLLLIAARHGHSALLARMLEGGADPRAANELRHTALHALLTQGHVPEAAEHRAGSSAPSGETLTAYRQAFMRVRSSSGTRGVSAQELADMATLLVRYGADPKATDVFGWTAGHYAARLGDVGRRAALRLEYPQEVEVAAMLGALRNGKPLPPAVPLPLGPCPVPEPDTLPERPAALASLLAAHRLPAFPAGFHAALEGLRLPSSGGMSAFPLLPAGGTSATVSTAEPTPTPQAPQAPAAPCTRPAKAAQPTSDRELRGVLRRLTGVPLADSEGDADVCAVRCDVFACVMALLAPDC